MIDLGNIAPFVNPSLTPQNQHRFQKFDGTDNSMSRWFRLDDDVVHDRKVQDLAPPIFKGWINLLCIASKHGGILPDINDIAFALRMNPEKASALVQSLTLAGLFDELPNGKISPHNWEKRQHKTDVSTKRVRAFRERQGNGAVKHDETH